ncbi:MAG: molecular chaperone TorD family protein [Coriobacteriia bacterium]|nr:molecular chaperone TorD family protein [Coriobacteriia bacterium]
MSESARMVSCVSSKSEVCSCHLVDRIDTYRELSRLFHGSEEAAADSIIRLVSATRSCHKMPYIDEDLIQSLHREAFLELLDPEVRRDFAIERVQLFGECDYDPRVNVVPPRESTYLDTGDGSRVESVRAAYAHAGYDPPKRLAALDCPDHIAVELDFMAHCLERLCGDATLADCAHDFFVDHLSGWAVLFAVATERRAFHASMRYSALVLDKFLACEAVTFRHSVPALCALRALPTEGIGV